MIFFNIFFGGGQPSDGEGHVPSWMGLQCAPPSFISTEEGVLPTTIIITPRIFTGFSHGLVCYKRQRFSYDTGCCHTLKNTCFHAKILCIMLFNKEIW